MGKSINSEANSNAVANDIAHEEYQASQKRPRSCFVTGILQKWAWLQKIFIIFLEKLFEMSAIFISRRPFIVMLCCLFITIALTCGFGKLKVEKNVKFLYLSENSEASQDMRRARNLGFELEIRQEEVIFLPKPGKSILSQECLAEMMDLHNIIIDIEHYNEYCFRPNSNSSCSSTNLLEAFGYRKENLVGNITRHIQGILQNDAFLMSNGRRLLDNFYQVFGKTASISPINSTNALRMVYFMKERNRGEEGRERILDWEKIFLNKVASFSRNITCANVFYAAERSLDDSVEESTGSDIKFFAVTFTIMGILSSIVNGRCADARFGHQLLGFSALLSIYLGVTSSFGFLMIVDVPFISMVGVLPFLVVSIGIDDVFIILHELNEMIRQDLPAMHMLSGTMARSGPTITMTTLTYLVAFAVSCRSIFPSIRFFCTYAALAISSVFLLLLSFFVGCMWFDIKRINAKRREFLPCLMSPHPNDCCFGIRRSGFDKVMKAWGKMIIKPAGKVFIFWSSILLLALGLYGARGIDNSFNIKLLTTEDSPYREFLNVYEENFNLNIEVSIIFTEQADQSSNEIQKIYSHVENLVKSNKYFVPGSISWLPEYISWAEKRNIEINNTRIFHHHLQEFISFPKYHRFAQDLKFTEDKTRLKASKILVYSRSDPDSTFQRNMMASIRKDLFHSADSKVFAVALPFIYFEQFAHVLDETIRNLLVAGISIIVISCLFLNHFVIIFCLVWGFVALIVELLGLMYIWNVSLNSISMINLVMALGFSVDYNAHVAFHFVSSKATTSELRVIDALSKVGGSVFLGGLSTFLGVMPTGFSSSTVFQTFFKMFVGIVILGLLHGLVILPVYLTLLGKIFDFREKSIDSSIKKRFIRTKKKSSKNKSLSSHDSVQKAKYIPMAIVGISCRFPGGANSKDSFWNMLVEGRCSIGPYPTNRPDAREFTESFNSGKNTPGKHYVLTGAFLENITGFDAQFFGISPIECRSMDPQQRILLQVVYEAIEDAGIRLEDLQQCRTGVYVGSMNTEYSGLVLDQSNIRNIDQFSSTGSALSVLANRISFSLNLTGPSLTMDTACSSSLVALDIAFLHLQNGECDVAIVCAPNILLVGNKFHTACCRTGLLAEDGRCKSFDIAGDGYGRGEGVAAVIIKPTQTALDDRDNIYAEVVACGTNNDGQTAIPMTAPSEVTQAALFERVLRESGASKDDISYVEAHGTGTAIGDVVEMGSLSEVYGNSSARVLRVGSVKSNINHTESTAGLAGLIKVCLMIKHAQFVPTVNVYQVKPQLKMSERKMVVQVSNEPWVTEDNKPRTAAISSYGFGGANAHAIVKEVTKKPATIVSSKTSFNRVLTLSAASKDALRAMAKNVSKSLKIKPEDDEVLKDNICYSLNERYTMHPHRLAISFYSFKDAVKALEMFASQTNGWEEIVATGDVVQPRNKVVFLYGGQGAQWYGMAKEMLVHEPKFKESIAKIDALLGKYNAPWSLVTELNKPEEASRLHENPIGQTALFAIHFALTELLNSWGIRPSAVVGHSLGEISAAWASGALPLNKALQLVLFRSQLQEKCSPTGCMAAIGTTEEDARRMIQDLQLDNEVDVAVVNSPRNIVLSGNRISIDLVENHVSSQRRNLFWKKLSTTRAYHSREMDEIKQAYFKITCKFNVGQTQSNIPFYSTVTGAQLSGHLLSLDHWWRNIRQTVLLESALKNMFSDGHQFFIEINAAPQLSYHVRQTWSHNHQSGTLKSNDVVVVQTLPKRSANDQHLSFLQKCVAHLFVNGVPLSWNKVQSSGSKSFYPRPTYPWQEKEFWYHDAHPPEFVTFLDVQTKKFDNQSMTTSTFHPLLGKTVPTETFTGLHAWESEINLHDVSYIKDHKFSQTSNPVIPGAVYIEMIAAMSLHLAPRSAPEIRSISFDNLLTISSEDSYVFRTRLLPGKSFGIDKPFQITIVESDEKETVISHGSIQLDINDGHISDEAFPRRNFRAIEVLKSGMKEWLKADIQKVRENMGFVFGPQFDLITQAWSNGTEALSLICPTDEITSASAYVMHPSVIDACLQTTLLLKSITGKFVPKKITDITILQKTKLTQQFYAHAKIVDSEKTPTYNITLMDEYGQALMIIDKFTTAEILSDKEKVTFDNAVFTFGWQQLVTRSLKGHQDYVWLVLRDQSEFAERFAQHIPQCKSVNFVDVQDTPDTSRNAFSQALDEVLGKINGNQKLLVINFWPVDARKFNADVHNFGIVHSLAFESCLLISQEILKRDAFLERIQLVFVTSGVVSIPEFERNPAEAFPWSASVFGFRRAFSEEIAVPTATVIDLPNNPSDDDFHAMRQDVGNAVLEEEIVYRRGVRYVNRIEKFVPGVSRSTKQESPLWKDGTQKPIKLASMSGQCFLQKETNERVQERKEIEVDFACPIVHKHWRDMKVNDRISIAGKICNGPEELHDSFAVGVCKVGDLGSFVAAEKCCFSVMKVDFATQQAASIGFPMVMSYHILANLLGDLEGNSKVLVYHQSEEVCYIFACVAASLNKTVVCLVDNQASENQMKKLEKCLVVTEDEITRANPNDVCFKELDAVCFLSSARPYITRQILKRLKSGATVIVSTFNGEERVIFNQWIYTKDVRIIFTSLKDVAEDSADFSELMDSCCSAMKSKGLWNNLLNIPQQSSSIYDVMMLRNESNKRSMEHTSDVEKRKEFGLNTISLRPKNVPDKVDFYSLPLDDNGLKDDRTYLVIGGVRGFGFEVARWMVENGAKTVVCTARSAPSEEKKAEVQVLEKKTGSRIFLRQADVTSWEEMNVIKSELESLPAVAGIVFTAMVLVDQLLNNADLKTCRKVVGTKVEGSVILHQLSLSMDLDFFIMFSSISGVLGNAGQASYAAANSFLDQLCEYRRNKLSLPALSVNWGPISGAGVLERNKDITSLLETSGLLALHCSKAIEFMKSIILENFNGAQVCVCPVNWQIYLKSHTSPRLQLKRDETMVVADDIMRLENLALQPLEFRVNYIQDFVKHLLSSWSGSDVSELDLNVGLYKYGIDSIAATNMKLRIKSSIGATFETYYFIQPKVSGLTIVNDILEQIENINTTGAEGESSEKVSQRKNNLPDVKKESIFVENNPLVPEISAFHNSGNEGNEDGLEPQSVEKQSNPERVIPLYSPENVFVKVFMVHASLKTALALASFAQGFQKQAHIALYGIGVDDTSFEKSDYGTVRTLARRYVDLIRNIQPSGPFYLAGYSFGGMVAYEMASELRRKNETVAMVFMVDTYGWHPKALTNCSEFMRKSTEHNLELTEKYVKRQLIEKKAFVELGMHKHELDNFYGELQDDEVVAALENQAAVKNLAFPLKEKVDKVLYELRSAAKAHLDWQPSKICYEGALMYVCCDETKSFSLSTQAIWKTLVERMDLLYVPGNHLQLDDETRGEICGSMMMTAAAMKYLSKFPYHNFQAVRSRRQERLVEFLKQGLAIWMLSGPSSSKWIKGTFSLDCKETVFSFEYESLGFHKVEKVSIKDLTNIVPGRHVDIIQKHHGNKSYVNFLTCMLTTKSGVQTFRSMDWQRLKLLVDGLEALFGVPFMQ